MRNTEHFTAALTLALEEEAAGLNIWVDQPIFGPIAAAEDLRRLGVQVLKSAT